MEIITVFLNIKEKLTDKKEGEFDEKLVFYRK